MAVGGRFREGPPVCAADSTGQRNGLAERLHPKTHWSRTVDRPLGGRLGSSCTWAEPSHPEGPAVGASPSLTVRRSAASMRHSDSTSDEPAQETTWHCASTTPYRTSPPKPTRARSRSTTKSATVGRSCSRTRRTSRRYAPPNLPLLRNWRPNGPNAARGSSACPWTRWRTTGSGRPT